MVLSSIPIEDVDAELEQYPPEIAFAMLRDLQASPIISVQEAWREHYPELLKKYRKRLMEPIEQQKELTESMMKVAERKTIGQMVMEQNNYGVPPSLTAGGNDCKVAELPIE